MRSSSLDLVKEFLFPRRYEQDSIPPLDGGLTPNDALDELDAVAAGPVPRADDIVRGDDGVLYVSSERKLLRLSGDRYARRDVVATFDGEAGALARTLDGAVFVAVAGHGVVRVDTDGSQRAVVDHADDGAAVRCVTGMAVDEDGTLYLTDGSTRHTGQDWVRDLMEANRCGRLLAHTSGTGATRVIARDLAYPAGVCVDGDGLVVTEAWTHRISRFDDSGRATVMRANLPGYPGRIAPAAGGGYWLAVFARRTLLVEFVLTQRDFVEEMMRTIEPEYWVRPALRTVDSGLVPVQGGQIRKLGVLKPWAPPRSYGLVVRLDADGHPMSSLHSRSGGRRHGVTAAREVHGSLVIAVHGGDQVLLAPEVAR